MTVTSPTPQAPTDTDEQFTQLASWLIQTLRALSATSSPPVVLQEATERGSLHKRHLPALLAITFAGPLSVSDLAARLGLGLSTTSTLVGDLSRAGLVARSEDEHDRRRTIVRLDHEHRDTITAWASDLLSPLRRTLERLTPDAREHFIDGWRILHEEATLATDRKGVTA